MDTAASKVQTNRRAPDAERLNAFLGRMVGELGAIATGFNLLVYLAVGTPWLLLVAR